MHLRVIYVTPFFPVFLVGGAKIGQCNFNYACRRVYFTSTMRKLKSIYEKLWREFHVSSIMCKIDFFIFYTSLRDKQISFFFFFFYERLLIKPHKSTMMFFSKRKSKEWIIISFFHLILSPIFFNKN